MRTLTEAAAAKVANADPVELAEIGLAIKNRRHYLGKMQIDVAGPLGCTVSFVSRIESGKRRADRGQVETIAAVLDVDPTQLVLGALVAKRPLEQLIPENTPDVEVALRQAFERLLEALDDMDGSKLNVGVPGAPACIWVHTTDQVHRYIRVHLDHELSTLAGRGADEVAS